MQQARALAKFFLRTKPEIEADDVAQDALTKAWGTFDPARSAWASWLTKCIRWAVADAVRTHLRRRRATWEPWQPPSPATAALVKEHVEALVDGVDPLSFAAALTLGWASRYDRLAPRQQQLAARAGVHQTNIAARGRRALERMRANARELAL